LGKPFSTKVTHKVQIGRTTDEWIRGHTSGQQTTTRNAKGRSKQKTIRRKTQKKRRNKRRMAWKNYCDN
jgi:hypothetical protein